MKKNYTILFFLVFSISNLIGQSAGTYDATFSGDGKEIYSGEAYRPFVFVYNNDVLTFAQTVHQINDSVSISEISLIKHTMAGVYISKTVILSDSSNTIDQMMTYQLFAVKQTNNGKFVISFDELYNEYANNNDYTANLAVVDANGILDNTFDTDGKKDFFFGTGSGTGNQVNTSLMIDLYPDNSILSVMPYETTNFYTKIYCQKISTTGVITNTFNVGAGNYNYHCTDVKVNADNTLFLAGASDYLAATNGYYRHFVFKLTSGFNYSTVFNTTGKLFIGKGEAYPPANGNQPTPIFILNSSSTDLYTFLQVADTTNLLGVTRPTYIQKYNSSGTFSVEKLVSTPTTVLELEGIKEDNSGKIITLSTEFDTNFDNGKTYLIRLNPSNLTYDASFNSNGKKTLSFSGVGITDNIANSFCIQSDDKIVTASNVTMISFLALARVNGTAVVTDINNYQSGEEFSLFPNPAKDQLKIRISNKEEFPISIEFYNTRGQLVKSAIIENDMEELSLVDLAEGLYIVKGTNNRGFNQTTKILIQK